MRKIVLLLACALLTGCAPTRQNTEGFTKSEVAETHEVKTVIEALGTGYFATNDSKYLIGGVHYYTAYKDIETGYCFISLVSASNEYLLIPLVNKDGTYKEYSDSNTNVMTPVGTSQDDKLIIIRDDDTDVEYVFDVNMNSYFIRGTSADASTEKWWIKKINLLVKMR